MSWTTLPDDCKLAGLSLKEADVRRKTGASIVAVVRDKEFHPNPGPDFKMAAGDTLAVIGRSEDRKAFLDLAGDGRQNAPVC